MGLVYPRFHRDQSNSEGSGRTRAHESDSSQERSRGPVSHVGGRTAEVISIRDLPVYAVLQIPYPDFAAEFPCSMLQGISPGIRAKLSFCRRHTPLQAAFKRAFPVNSQCTGKFVTHDDTPAALMLDRNHS
jgi:hypothetical protein